ncbi:venom carboxylesterase-6-like [Neodiprion pinetum]|uniref:venom carboxylesterase-6-like n=1 Tax=Neodiprion pinetum TaxID=441929 RepID=UPI001EDEAFBA|nr:venom carboxylesterase-6-like [Neodiprion pinetum]
MKFAVMSGTILTLLWGCHPSLSQEVEGLFPRVVTPLGYIEGYYKISNNGRRYEAYEGIPYAETPIGELRFRIAKSISPWAGVLMAKRFGPPCLQYNHFGVNHTKRVNGSEDCLYMNIYTTIADDDRYKKAIEPSHLLPVVFFIHGGAFQFGSGSDYRSKYLLDREVTLVTFNYRLGPFGFLSTEDATVPGNMGLKDQVMALRWVADNIQHFGGDPSRITIIGQSAGGASVHYHYLTNLSAGLFKGGMSLSGTALDCWTQTEGALQKTEKLATIVGCPSENVPAMVECLRTRPAQQIAKAVGDFMPWLYNPFTPFGPVVEKGGSEFTFIDRSPIEIINSGQVQDVPWITSITSEEGLYPAADFTANEKLLKQLNNNWESIAPHLLDFNYTVSKSERSDVARLIRQHYLGTKPIDKSTVKEIVQMVGDRLFVYNGIEAARLQARVNQSPVRFYYFSYRGAHSLSESMSRSTQDFGVSHGDDLAYVMQSFFDPTTIQEDRDMQEKLLDLWVTYATEGVPNVGIDWPNLSKSTDEFPYLYIAGAKEFSVKYTPNYGEKKFWDSLNFCENVMPSKNFEEHKKIEL